MNLPEIKFGNTNDNLIVAWFNLIKSSPAEADMLKLVNDFFNTSLTYKEDIDVWEQTDYWATPYESLRKGAGDCEDYALAKYFTLRLLGIPSSKMFITYVNVISRGIAHMVLVYDTPTERLVLDNLVPDIMPANQRADLASVYSFNAEGLYLPSVKGEMRTSDTKNLSRWQDVLQKMRTEGFDVGEG